MFSIVIPAFNEEKSISLVLKKIQTEIPESEIIVVDDCSTDDTARIVESNPKVRLIRHSSNKGQMNAITTGIQGASFDIVVTMDADGQHPKHLIRELVEPISHNEADLVLGVRKKLPRIAEQIIALGSQVSDGTTGFRALKRELGDYFEGDFVYGGMAIVRARRDGYRVKEYPITVLPRIAGNSTYSSLKMLGKSLKFIKWTYSST